MEPESLTITKKGWKRFIQGHPWVFNDELVDLPEGNEGAILPLFDGLGRFLGKGFYNPRSKIVVRIITYNDQPVDADFWRARLIKAIQFRGGLSINSNARRLVFSEADGFPGLIVDDFNGCLSMQILTLGMEKLKSTLVGLLQEELSPSAIVERNDSPVRKLEGLEEGKGILSGHLAGPVRIDEGDLSFNVDPMEGQKTGAYLDQRDNRIYLRAFAKDRRVLDAFCYDGWFALHLAKAGASEVVALDSSEQALARLEENAAMNGISSVQPLRGNCFKVLKQMTRDKEEFDLVVLDPPPFARRKADVGSAMKAYREINQRGLQLVSPGGFLFTCCCSHGISQDMFSKTVAMAAGKIRRRLVLVDQKIQPLDHPILFNEPESLYLKGMLFRCMD